MAKLSLRGGAVRTDQDDARLRDALRDLDYWRDRAHTFEQDAKDAKADADDENDRALKLEVALDVARDEIERLKATALPPPMDGRPIVPTTDPVQALIGEALDMEMGGEE